jgi:DNA-binding response OmpR family regulator
MESGAATKVMVIDDEKSLAELLEVNLQFEGFSVTKASSGVEGLNIIENDHPDIIILDVRMPGLDGFEVCQRLKKNDETRHIPVVMVSAYAQEADIQKGLDAGAAAYIKKPFDVLHVVETIRKILKIP